MKKIMVVMISSLFFVSAGHADEMKKTTAKAETRKEEKKQSTHFLSKDHPKKDAAKSEEKKSEKK